MSHTCKKLPGEPIILYQSGEGYTISAELESAVADMRALLDVEPESVYLITDTTNEPTPNMDDLLIAADKLARGPNPLYHHPKIKKLLVVVVNPLLRASFQGGNSEAFGYLEVILFDMLDDALVYARAGN